MIRNYLKVAFKVFLRRKFFTFISLFGIAVTLAVLTVAVSFFDHIFGPQIPETRADRTLGIYLVHATGPNNDSTGPAGYAFHESYVQTLPGVEKVSTHSFFLPVISYLNGVEINSYVKHIDGFFWDIYSFNFIEGSPFTQADEENASFVAVINESTRRKFFGNSSAVGKTIELDHRNFRIIGVVSDVPMLRFTTFSDIWVPSSTQRSDLYKQEFHNGLYFSSILAGSPSDLEGIREEFASMLNRIEYPDTRQIDKIEAEPQTLFEAFSDMLFGGYLLAVILVAMVLFMLLPTINLININVSRIRERSSEIGVRKAFGASSVTLVGQFIVENVLLTIIGGIFGFVCSWLVLYGLNSSDLIPYANFQMNYRIFLCGLAIAIFFGLFSGVYPAWRMSRLHPVAALRGRA